MATDPNTLVLNQILSEIQKLNNFEAQAQRTAQSLAAVQRADAQTPVNPSLVRQAGAGAQLPGSLSTSASTPDLLNQDELQQASRRELDQLSDQQIGGQRSGIRPGQDAEQAVAWSLLSEAGIGGPLGRLRQTQYSVGQNLGAVGNALGTTADRLDVSQINTLASGGSVNPLTRAASTAVNAASSANQFFQNRELATSVGVEAISTGRRAAQDWYEQGAALGYGTGNYGGIFGAGRYLTNASTTNEGRLVAQTVRQLQGIHDIVGGMALGPDGATRPGQGLTHADAQALVGQLFEQGYSAQTGSVFAAGGNLPEMARGLAPAVQMMGQQGAQIAGSWTEGLRSANDSLSDLTRMLEQFPEAAKASQLGLEGFNQSLQQIAQTVTSMGGTSTEAMQMGLNFEQQHPGLNPQDVSGLLSSPIVQAFGLQQGVLPSGLSAISGGQFNDISQSAVRTVMGALSGLAPAQQWTTLADGRRVRMNDPQAMVAQQAASQFFPGVNPQDLLSMLNQSPQRQQAVGALQYRLGQNMGPGHLTGLDAILGGGSPQRWNHLSRSTQQEATQYWNQQIAPLLHQTQSASQIAYMNQTGNISKRMAELSNNLFNAGKSGANDQNNAATVKIEIGLASKAAGVLTAKASYKDQSKAVQNAGGATINVPLNSALGQNPAYGGNGNLQGYVGRW